ncbi:MAG TPA: SRPBCC family protein [Ktedonobacterales bacterium]|nr:SRPBCC family protein [Ktedonobacterales bacterium]
MAQVHVTAERVVDAPPSEVFMFLSDYKNRRPTILPDNYQNYRVDAGGVGAGTDVEYVLHAGRRERPYYLHVDAPEPGRRLIERDTRSSLVNTWTVEPADDGKRSTVRLATAWSGASGVGGFFERTFAPMGLRRIYTDMLARLAAALEPAGRG